MLIEHAVRTSVLEIYKGQILPAEEEFLGGFWVQAVSFIRNQITRDTK